MNRPFFSKKLHELRGLAEGAWNSPEQLRQLHEELCRRSTPMALKLRDEVAVRLTEFRTTSVRKDPRVGTPGPRNGVGKPEQQSPSIPSRLREHELAEECDILREKVNQLETQLARYEQEDDYTLVGLSPSCPLFLISAAENAYKRNWHPDMLLDQPVDVRELRQLQLEQVLAALERIRVEHAIQPQLLLPRITDVS
jgi:hypothetical protein